MGDACREGKAFQVHGMARGIVQFDELEVITVDQIARCGERGSGHLFEGIGPVGVVMDLGDHEVTRQGEGFDRESGFVEGGPFAAGESPHAHQPAGRKWNGCTASKG